MRPAQVRFPVMVLLNIVTRAIVILVDIVAPRARGIIAMEGVLMIV